MPSNPYLNALLAAAYVWGIGLFLHYISAAKAAAPNSFIDPVAALSLLVFSAALMGFLFFYRPAVLLIENKRTEALDFFFKTLGTFGVLTLIVLILLTA